MKKIQHISIGILLLVLPCARAGIITLTADSTHTNVDSSEITIGAYETAEVVSFPYYINLEYVTLEVFKNNSRFVHYAGTTALGPSPLDPLIVTGPATLRLNAYNGTKGLCTIRITPEAFPPDKALLVPPGTNQARITLECSTNLVQWFSATNGVYGPLPEAKFFRIKLEPVQP